MAVEACSRKIDFMSADVQCKIKIHSLFGHQCRRLYALCFFFHMTSCKIFSHHVKSKGP